MTKDERLSRAEECLKNAEAAAADPTKADTYLKAADLWMRLAISADQ